MASGRGRCPGARRPQDPAITPGTSKNETVCVAQNRGEFMRVSVQNTVTRAPGQSARAWAAVWADAWAFASVVSGPAGDSFCILSHDFKILIILSVLLVST